MSMFSRVAKASKGKAGKAARGKTIQTMLMVVMGVLVSQVMAGEEEPSAAGVSMSATLLGSISFIMCLYYFINYDDEDIKEMAWQTISGTISIFCAVLLWSSFNDMAEAYIIDPIFGKGDATKGAMFVDIIHMLIWFAIMQLSLALLSGAAGPGDGIKGAFGSVDEDRFKAMNEEEQEEVKEAKEVNMACFAVLCAHITGFASINAFGTIQGIYFSGSPLKAMLTPLLALVVMLILQRVTDTIRRKIALGDDGEEDCFEELWDDECEEAENDVMGLALSFTTINALRFAISGCLPNQEGKEEECPAGFPEEYLYHHTFGQKVGTIAMGFAFAIIIFIMRSNWPEWLEPAEIKKQPKAKRHNLQILARLTEGIYVAVSMCFSWSFFFGLQMCLASVAFFEGEPELMAVVLALLVSALCMGNIIPLDQLADASWTDEHADTAIRSIMSAMGLLIGFGWEQCFDASVDAIARKSEGCPYEFINVHTTKLLLTIFCAGLLVPAWKWYMLPFIVAKGWEAEYPLRAAALTAKNLESHPCEIKKEKIREEVAKLAETCDEVNCIANSGAAEAGESKTPYTALAGNESIDSLKKEVASLTAELAKAKNASLQEQKMLDATMESMLLSMKQMNETVARIEGH